MSTRNFTAVERLLRNTRKTELRRLWNLTQLTYTGSPDSLPEKAIVIRNFLSLLLFQFETLVWW